MCPALPNDLELFEGDEEISGRGGAARPERLRQHKISRRAKMQARRSRSNEMAKRGIHQRRSKRTAW